MSNFIERTLADAARSDAARKDAANKVKADAAREERDRIASVEEAGERVFKETGISGTLEVIAANVGGKIWKSSGGYMTKNHMKKDEPYHAETMIALTKGDGRSKYEAREESSVIVLYREDGSVVIESAAGNEFIETGDVMFPHRTRAQILTPQQLQNNDVVAAALEKAIKNPMKNRLSPDNPSPPQGY